MMGWGRFVFLTFFACACRSGTLDQGVPGPSTPSELEVQSSGATSPPLASSDHEAPAGATTEPWALPSAEGEGSSSAVASPAVASPAVASSTSAEPRRRCRVLAVGDSLTDYATHGGGYLRYLEKRCPQSRFDNRAKGGAMVNQMRRRFPTHLAAGGASGYTHVVVFGGVNDLYSDLTAHRTNEKIQSDLLQIYEQARAAGARVVAIGVAPWGGFTKYWNERREQNTLALNRWIGEQVGQGVDHYVDAHTLLGCGAQLCPEYFAPFRDGIHFGPPAHEKLGRELHEKVFQNCL